VERARLREELERLHEELQRTPSIDAESRQLLSELARDIRTLLERSDDERSESDASLGERLREATERFEESHPALTSLVGRIADQLSRMGI